MIILFTILTGYAAPANAISDEVKQRVQADLKGKCLENFLNDKFTFLRPHSYQRLATGLIDNAVFAFGEINSQQYCSYAVKGIPGTWEDAEKRAIASCETVRPQGGTPCEVYAHNNDIIYVSIHEKLKTATKLFEAGDPAAQRVLNEIKARNLSNLSPDETGEYEYLFGKVLINSKSEQDKAEAIPHLNNSWSNYGNVNAAVEEGNARMMAGDIEKDWHWQPIRAAYQYFLAHASDEQKLLHPEVEQNLKQTEPYYQADLAQKEEAVKERARLGAIETEREAKQQAIIEEEQQKQAKIDAIQAKREVEQQAAQARLDAIKAKREAEQQAKQDQLDAIKAEREAKQQEQIRLAEEKRKAKEGDGSADDTTCKSYGARMGTPEYINCRIQLRTKQTSDEQQAAQNRAADEQRAAQDRAANEQQAAQNRAANEQQAAQIRAANEQQAAQADYNNRLEAARQAEQARRDAADQNRRESAALMAIGGALMRGSTPQQAPPPRAPIQCYSLGNIIQCQ